jgi:hypothetical protein
MAALLAVAALSLWLAGDLRQPALAWPAAIAADLLLLLILLLAASGRAKFDPRWVPVLALATFGLFAGVATATTLLGRRPPGAFELVQSPLALVVGLGGGAAVAVGLGHGAAYGAIGLALALAGTALARRHAFFLWLWSAAGLIALAALTRGPALPLGCAAAGLALLAARQGAAGLVALAAAAATSGLFLASLQGLIGAHPVPPPPVALAVLVALAAAAALAFRLETPAWLRLALLVAALACAAGVIAWAAIAALDAGRPAAAAVRSAVLALAAVAVAAASRTRRGAPLVVLVYPLLGAGALKLVVEDFAVGVPATEFLGLALFGIALIVASRLRRAASG